MPIAKDYDIRGRSKRTPAWQRVYMGREKGEGCARGEEPQQPASLSVCVLTIKTARSRAVPPKQFSQLFGLDDLSAGS